MKRSFALTVTAILLSTAVAGCSGSDGSSDQSPPASPDVPNQVTGETAVPGDSATRAELEGRTFSATGAEGVEITKKNPLEIAFEQSSLSVDADCNSMDGNYSLEGGDIQAFLSTTEIGCSPKQVELEVFVSELLRQGAAARLGGNTLVLEGKNATSLTLAD